MFIANIQWRFLRKVETNMVVVIGEGASDETSVFLLNDSIKIIRIAKKFYAVPIQTQDEFKLEASGAVVVRLALLFKDEASLRRFFRFIKTHRI